MEIPSREPIIRMVALGADRIACALRSLRLIVPVRIEAVTAEDVMNVRTDLSWEEERIDPFRDNSGIRAKDEKCSLSLDCTIEPCVGQETQNVQRFHCMKERTASKAK